MGAGTACASVAAGISGGEGTASGNTEANAGSGTGDDGSLAGDVHLRGPFLFRRIDLFHQRQAFHR